MNANELADWLDEYAFLHDADIAMQKVSAMLRQQQAEIEALKNILEQEGIGVGRDLLNGGIALFRKAEGESFDRTASHMAGQYVAHPVKELTDEEIEEIASQYLSAHAQFIGAGECHYEGEIEFARAILRKAKEK